MNNNITTIQLIGNVQGYLDLDEETILPLTFSLSDIRELSSKTGSFSKSIKIKGTKNNNKLLNHYFDVNIEAGTFDINIKQKCVIIQNGVPIFDNAIIQLVDVIKKETTNSYDEQIEYTVLVKDTTADFFSIINSKYLDELDLGIPDFTYKADRVIGTFDNTYEDGYKFLLPFNNADGTTVPDANESVYNLNELKPAIYVRTYLDTMFRQATGTTSDDGYRYNFPAANDDSIQLNKLVIPFNGDEIKNDTVTNESVVEAQSNISSFVNTYKTSIIHTEPFYQNKEIRFFQSTETSKLINVNNEISDPNNIYNSTNSTYESSYLPSNQNIVEYDIDFDYELYVENNESFSVYHKTIGFDTYVEFTNRTTDIKPIIKLVGSNNITKDTKTFLPNKVYTLTNGQGPFPAFSTTVLASGTILGLKLSKPNNIIEFYKLNSHIVVDGVTYDSRPCWVQNPSDKYSSKNLVDIKLKITNVKVRIKTIIMGEYGYNVPIQFNKFIPKKIKQSDFLKGLLTMFNLYTEIDDNDPKQINIYRRDDYYDNGVTKDWTNKLVKDEDKDIRFLPELTNKRLVLTYKKDEDIPNKQYLLATNETYGQQEFIFDNEYVKDTKTIETIFSPTPSFNTGFGAIVPMINGASPSSNIRILYDGGQYSCSQYKIINYNDGGIGLPSSTATTVYPFISHWDKPSGATFDLNFSICDFYYRTDEFNTTNNNLYNLHWKRTVNLINNGKMLKAKFVLNENDISSMKLSDKILVNNSWWNINKIIDYDANSNNPTTVELISFDDYEGLPFSQRIPKFVSKNTPTFLDVFWGMIRLRRPWINPIGNNLVPIRGMNNEVNTPVLGNSFISGNDNILGEGKQIVYGDSNISNDTSFIVGDNNTNYYKDNYILGNSNTLSGSNINVFGSNNLIESNELHVFGNRNTIPSGITNSVILGSYITADTSNTVFVSNFTIASGGTFNGIQIDRIVSGATNSLPLSGGVLTGPVTGTSFIVSGGTSTDALIADGTLLTLTNGSFSGSYSSTPSGLSPITVTNSVYSQVGDVVTANIGFSFNVTAITPTEYTITVPLPVTRSASTQRMIGQGNFYGGLSKTGGVLVSTATTSADILFNKTINGSETVMGNITIQYSHLI